MTLKVLNLYAGIGGNRKLWDDVTDLDVTAVEWDGEKAEIYRDYFPDDRVVEADAHEYLLEHFNVYDFIWASPPCPTHSKMRETFHQKDNPVYPDMKVYQEILLLQHTFDGDWVVENVNPYYDPLIEAQRRARHLFWSNFHIPEYDGETANIRRQDDPDKHKTGMYGFDVSDYGLGKQKARKVLNNLVDPELGEHIFKAATTERQATLF
jgi:DNA (cytosine-5)-methyltransferase 1